MLDLAPHGDGGPAMITAIEVLFLFALVLTIGLTGMVL
jgi:hypothetical protein